MMKEQIRHWVLIDLHQFRQWATDDQIKVARLIDNRDGTYGRAFDLRSVPPEMLVAISPTMELALQSGMNAVDTLPSGPTRRTTLPPSLQDLVAKYGRYDLIPEEAWIDWDEKQAKWRSDYLANRHVIKDSVIPIDTMAADEISAELRARAEGNFPQGEQKRRQQLWRRLDELRQLSRNGKEAAE